MSLSLLVLIFGTALLVNQNFYDYIFGDSMADGNKPLMGVVSHQTKDTRHKKSGSFVWGNARKRQQLRLGDSLFTGVSSTSSVNLRDGNKIVLGENSLVTFNEAVQMADLGLGNYSIRVDGRITFSVQGQVTVIEGRNSNVQFILEEGKAPQVRLLEGEARLHIAGRTPYDLVPNRLEANLFEKRSTSIALLQDTWRALQAQKAPYLRFYDIYEVTESNQIVRKIEGEPEDRVPIEDTVFLSALDPRAVDGIDGKSYILVVESSSAFEGFVLEASTDINFPPEKTSIHFTAERSIPIRLKEEGKFYYRIRGVNTETGLTAFTEPVLVDYSKPRLAEKSRRPKRQVAKDDSQLKQETLQMPALIDPRQRRRLSSEQSMFYRAYPTRPQSHGHSQVGIELGTFTAYSPDEADIGREGPLASMLGIRAKHWLGKNGGEFIGSLKVADLNDTARGINPLKLEARYHRSLSRRMSAFAGMEMYRNIGLGYFSQKYDLAKLGIAFDLPIGGHWDAGADLAYGMDSDQTTKYEFLGRVNYYFRSRYSVGFGYRFYLLEAGSIESAPLELPYKEAHGEGFLTLRWFYDSLRWN